MPDTNNKVLVMYDVRGIQNYIFRTSKLKDAIGASSLVENIFEDTLSEAVKTVGNENGDPLKTNLKWFDDEKGALPFSEDDSDVIVLYIGGGNACVMMKNRSIAVEVSKVMSRLVMERTYSLQLAVAIENVSGVYRKDYENLNAEMTRVKADMIVSKPPGALPIMEVEIKTGFPAVEIDSATNTPISLESQHKKSAADKARNGMNETEKKMESYITEKEVDSTIAVVHIDGNNMGLRIRELIEGIDDYCVAVSRMREISYNINNGFKSAFNTMKDYFNETSSKSEAFNNKINDYYLVKVIVAGDDITYVCNGKIALESVEYFARTVSRCAMISQKTSGISEEENIKKYGFSVCAGISYIGSHFPFNIAYDVAESCCDEAKKTAKNEKNIDGGTIGSWVDFMFCRNVQTRNLKDMRKREYETRCRERLLSRPYFIPLNDYDDGTVFKKLADGNHSLSLLKKQLSHFGNEKAIPRSQAKELRNTYPLGQGSVEMLMNFLKSRGVTLPDGEDAYYEEDGQIVASCYDALELLDMYAGLDEIGESKKENEQ